MRCARPAVRMGQDPSLHFYPKKGFFYKLSFPPMGSRFCRRAASPLAAAAVCGGGRCPGGMNPSPTMQTAKRDLAQARGPGMPGPYRAVSFPCPRSRAGVIGTTAVRGCFLFVRPVRGRTNKKAPSSGAENDGVKRNKQTAKGAEQNAETEAQPVIGRNRAGEANSRRARGWLWLVAANHAYTLPY